MQSEKSNALYRDRFMVSGNNIRQTSRIQEFIRTIGYSGLFSVEFIRGKDGKDYFLEINMRNDGNAYCVESAGVNLPYIWVYYQTYGKMPDVQTTFTDPVYFIPDLNDLKLAFKQNGPFKWLKQFREAQSHSIYNKQDMGPFKFEIKRQVKRVFGMKKNFPQGRCGRAVLLEDNSILDFSSVRKRTGLDTSLIV